MHGRLMFMALSTAWLTLGTQLSVALGDGGAVRSSERRGDRLITVFTAPTPPHAGTVDISVLVQDAGSGRPLLDLPIMVRAHPIQLPHEITEVLATTEAATNKLMRAAQLDLTEPGSWHIEVTVEGANGPPVVFDVEVVEPPPAWLRLSPWIGWPFGMIALFAIHQTLLRKRRSSPMSTAARA
jgi:hypothetical protein